MNRHIVPSIVASVLSCGAALGFLHFSEPKYRVTVQNAQAGSVSPAKAARIAKTVWPELSQDQIDELTKELKTLKPVPVTIFCISDDKCGDLSLSLENAFESAHWRVTTKNTTMAPEGIRSSSRDIFLALGPYVPMLIDDAANAGPGEYVVIGDKPDGWHGPRP